MNFEKMNADLLRVIKQGSPPDYLPVFIRIKGIDVKEAQTHVVENGGRSGSPSARHVLDTEIPHSALDTLSEQPWVVSLALAGRSHPMNREIAGNHR